MIWVVLFGVAAAAIALMVIPLRRRTDSAQSRAAFDAQIYRDQLTEMELDAERGQITAEQAASARTEIARRLLAATSGETPAENTRTTSQTAWRGVAVCVGLAVPTAAFGVYLLIGSPHLPARPAAQLQAEHAMAKTKDATGVDGATLIARLGEQLKKRPDDLRGWTLYAESLVRMGRFSEAVSAFRRVTTLSPRDVEMASRLAEAQIFAAEGSVTPAARASLQATLALDPKEPRARYYLGLAESQAGKIDAALKIWMALEADSAPNAPWRPTLAKRITELAERGNITAGQLAARRTAAEANANANIAPATPPQTAQQTPGPSAEDVEAAQSMPQKDRMEMIRGMVVRLADRLKDNPDDITGWQRLAHSYDVLGEAENARDAYGHLAKQRPNDVKVLADYAGAFARTLPKDAAIPPALAALGDQILALDPKHSGALWITGMAHAQAGDAKRARERWTRLLAELEPQSERYATVKKSIEALGKPRQ